MNKLLAIAAFVTFVAFLGILVKHVPRMDLMSVVAFTVLLAGWDLYTSLRKRKR